MATQNQSSSFQADVVNYIQKKVLRLSQRQLVAYQFGQKLTLDKQRGVTYTASRYDRIPLPFAPLAEGVPPVGELLNLSQVTATAQQWGDTVTITDVAEMTIYHSLFQQGVKLTSMQLSETLDRNTYNNLLAGTQVNYVGAVGSRAALTAGSILTPHEIDRALGILYTVGAPQYLGMKEEDVKVDVDRPNQASSDPRGQPHYAAIIHPLVEQDMRENSTVATAWSYSDINKLYNNELGYWGGCRFCRSNMVPSFTGVALVTGTAGTAGSLATNSYFIKVTGSNAQNGYEQLVYQVSGAIAVTGPNGSISVTTPNTAGYTFNIYIGTTTSPTNLGTSVSGPTVGSLAGQAVQIPPNTTVVITNIGTARTPPAAPQTGVTVYPTFIIGEDAYGQVMLDNATFYYLTDADKSDPLNQLRVIGWKIMYGTIILNQLFFIRIESSSAFSATTG